MGAGSFGQDADSYGVYGTAGGTSGFGLGAPSGVFGDSGSGFGVHGASNSSVGVKGESDSGIGVVGVSRADDGVHGFSTYGAAVSGECGIAGVAGLFNGTVNVNGNLTVKGGTLTADNVSSGVKQFRIDHPLEPADRYLVHASVESSEMKNIYDGVVALDSNGEAVVGLPAWFEPLNQDFRYQLTPLGAPGPNLYIAEEISHNHFKISGGVPGIKVSWQVTGFRHDAYAEAHRIQVEEDKPEAERGYYLHPELYGQPPEKGIAWAHHPELMQRISEREQQTNTSVPYPALPFPGAREKTGSLLDSPPTGT